jgi:hypothetical protein
MSSPLLSSPNTALENCFSLLSQWNNELIALYGKRTQEIFALPFSLMQCISPDDFEDLQEDYSRVLRRDYREAWDRLGLVFCAGSMECTETYAATILKAQEDAAKILELAREQAERIVARAHLHAHEPQVANGQVQAA